MKAALIAGYLVIVGVALVRVASTEKIFSATCDEPMHLACGLDWLYGRPYTAQPDNPPLARIVAALPFALDRVPIAPPSRDNVGRGNAVLYSGDYRRNVGRARAGNLLFLAAAIGAVGAWGTRRFGRTSGILGAALFAWLPPVRAHAGLATTDMAAAATFALAVVAFDRWLERPSGARGAALGFAGAGGMLSKFSFAPFFVVAAVIVAAVRERQDVPGRRRSAAIAGAVLLIAVWAGYRFRIGTVQRAAPAVSGLLRMVSPAAFLPAGTWLVGHVPAPAPLLFAGEILLGAENAHGHPAFLLGRLRTHGWWYYFPVALFLKTPLPFLALAAAGMLVAARRRRTAIDVALIPAAMLLSVLPASIDIGVRHLLPLYVPLSVAAGAGVVAMARRPDWRVVGVLLVGWNVIATEAAHPDYLAWFNEAAGPHPERLLSDSNLDWGQDWMRLAETIDRRKLRPVSVLFTGTVWLQNHLADHGAELRPVRPEDRSAGWYALPEGALAADPAAQAAYAWLDDYAFTRVGKSIRLYRVPR